MKGPKANTTDSSLASKITKAIQSTESLSCPIRDNVDELNILKATARYQKAVQEALAGGREMQADLTEGYAGNDITETDYVSG